MRLVCSAMIACLAATSLHAAPPSTTLKAADLQQDVAVLRSAYEGLHPGLYRYNTKSQMDQEFAKLAASLNHDQSLQDAYVAFSLFAAKVKCGHTYANFFNQPKAVVEELFQGQNRVPFYFEWLGNRMVVSQDFTPGHLLPRGTEIQAINGVPVDQILARLMTTARADGSNDAKRVASLGVRGDGKYETFDIYFPMFFPLRSSRMTFQVAGRTIQADALATRTTASATTSEIPFEWKILSGGAAYLKMPTWALFNSKWDWKTWLNSRLDEAVSSNAPALIVDLRGNEGGLDVGNVVLSRLVAKDLQLSASYRLVRYRQTPQDLAPYLDTWDPSFKDWGAAAVKLNAPWPTAPAGVSYYRLKRYDDNENGDVIEATGKRFNGKVFVLVDANNSSATFQFAQVVQQNKLGKLVGEPTGGNRRGINGGAFFFLRLPKSGIEMDLPLIGAFPATQQEDGGLQPDILVERTAKDIAEGFDPVMAAILK